MEYTQLQEEYERELALDSLPPQSLAALQWEVERSKLRREAHHQRTLQGLAEQIRTEEQMLRTLQSEIRELEKRIAESTVLAPISGTVSFLASFNVGEYLPPGFETLQIIPDHSSGYQVEIVIENTKISQVQPGQTVHYRIPSLPSRDYGPLQGRITYLTPDATITTARGALAYQALADVEDHHGVPIQLGMLAEARIQVGRTSILFYVLDKLDLMRRGPIPRG